MLCSNYALLFVDYPTQALAKSSKILPVMIMGIIQKTYNYAVYKYVCAIVMTVGLIVFNCAKTGFGFTVQSTSYAGYVLLILSLFFDGLVATTTDSHQKKVKLC
mmetsp:Transcript_41276/g.47584  ORF Transcript_41276/g.47584 Transcript_41276/m.47584 type:complete len:104 (+) Transcript_41276:334-645(+)